MYGKRSVVVCFDIGEVRGVSAWGYASFLKERSKELLIWLHQWRSAFSHATLQDKHILQRTQNGQPVWLQASLQPHCSPVFSIYFVNRCVCPKYIVYSILTKCSIVIVPHFPLSHIVRICICPKANADRNRESRVSDARIRKLCSLCFDNLDGFDRQGACGLHLSAP